MREKSYISDNLSLVEQAIHDACDAVGRRREEITLTAVTKTVEPSIINEAIACGVTHIGENRVQEFLAKKPFLNLDGVQTHLIGHLQTNKVRQIVGEVSMIQSVDSLRLAQMISDRAKSNDMTVPVLVEVNIGGEEQKSGVASTDVEELMYQLSPLSGIQVRGLMTVAPILHSEAEKRALFSKMYQLFIDIRAKNIDNILMQDLSMGMSGDYREAIMEGATIIRVGSAIFGKRQY